MDERVIKLLNQLAVAITPPVNEHSAGRCVSGGVVTSLTEAVMGVTSGLYEIAQAINRLAEAAESANSGEGSSPSM